jgi:transposase
MLRGIQFEILTPGVNRRINAFITAFWPSKRLRYSLYKRRRSSEFIQHLESVLRYMKRKGYRQLILIMHNATFHKARTTTLFLEAHRAELKAFYLPRYAPKLNEVDSHINRALKRDICSNHNYRTIQELAKATRLYLRQHNRKHKLRDLT